MRHEPGEEQRRFRRRTLRVLVDCLAPGGPLCDYATTLGAGGLFLETERPLPVGTPLRVCFRLPQGEILHRIDGRVVWRQAGGAGSATRRAPGLGIEFLDAPASAVLARELDALP